MSTLPKAEWSDEPLETIGIPTLQPLDLVPLAGLSGSGPIETCESVLSIAGLAGVNARPGGLSNSGSTSPATCGNAPDNCGESLPGPPVAATPLPWECYRTGAPISSFPGVPSQHQFRMTEVSGMSGHVAEATTTRQTFGEKVAHREDRRNVAMTVGGGDAGGDGKASAEQTAFGLKFFGITTTELELGS